MRLWRNRDRPKIQRRSEMSFILTSYRNFSHARHSHRCRQRNITLGQSGVAGIARFNVHPHLRVFDRLQHPASATRTLLSPLQTSGEKGELSYLATKTIPRNGGQNIDSAKQCLPFSTRNLPRAAWSRRLSVVSADPPSSLSPSAQAMSAA